MLPEVEQMAMDLEEIQELDPHKIIAAKLFEARATLHHGSALMVEDTSLYIDGMNGLPGPFIKWFMHAVGNEGVYTMAKAMGNGSAVARTIIGYSDEQGKMHFFEGETQGTIVSPRGESNFGRSGWDPIFLPEGRDKTYGEIDAEIKNKISQRSKALQKLKEHLSK